MKYKGYKIPKWLLELGFERTPKFYKELGPEAVMAYLHNKKHGMSTKHWEMTFGGTRLVFWSEFIPKVEVDAYLKSISSYLAERGKTIADCKTDWNLEKRSINKPWRGLTYETICTGDR